jgi:hypothetical protein
MKCWAMALGDCRGKQSREHHMSRGLWKGRTVRVKGFPWLKGLEKEVGVECLQSRVLCEGHNNALAPLDAEAQQAFENIERLLDELKRNSELKSRNAFRKPGVWKVNGSNFERWAAKLLIGLLCAEERESRWHDSNSEMLNPPEWAVRAVFGEETFQKPAGLYFATSYRGDLIDGLGVEPLFHPHSKGVVGGYISFGGIRFFIHLSQEPIEAIEFPPPTDVISATGQTELNYRMEMLRFPVRNVVNQKLVFSWDPVPQTTLSPVAGA